MERKQTWMQNINIFVMIYLAHVLPIYVWEYQWTNQNLIKTNIYNQLWILLTDFPTFNMCTGCSKLSCDWVIRSQISISYNRVIPHISIYSYLYLTKHTYNWNPTQVILTTVLYVQLSPKSLEVHSPNTPK